MFDRVIYRPATEADCPFLADLYLMASGGLAARAWGRRAAYPQSVLSVGTRLFADACAPLNFRNCRVADDCGKVVGFSCVHPVAADGERVIEPDPVLRPFAELRQPGSLFVAALAVYPEFRGAGIGTELLSQAEDGAEDDRLPSLSLQLFSDSAGLLAGLKRQGYRVIGKRPVVAHETLRHAGRVLLLSRDLSGAAKAPAPPRRASPRPAASGGWLGRLSDHLIPAAAGPAVKAS